MPGTPGPARIEACIDLYSPRVRRSTANYLMLRLLELREADLDRARAAIERRLSVDELLADPVRPGQADGAHERPRGGARQKAPGAPCRTDGP